MPSQHRYIPALHRNLRRYILLFSRCLPFAIFVRLNKTPECQTPGVSSLRFVFHDSTCRPSFPVTFSPSSHPFPWHCLSSRPVLSFFLNNQTNRWIPEMKLRAETSDSASRALVLQYLTISFFFFIEKHVQEHVCSVILHKSRQRTARLYDNINVEDCTRESLRSRRKPDDFFFLSAKDASTAAVCLLALRFPPLPPH